MRFIAGCHNKATPVYPSIVSLTDEPASLDDMVHDPEFALAGLMRLLTNLHYRQTNPRGVHLRDVDFTFLVA
jgi:hypothetical protein